MSPTGNLVTAQDMTTASGRVYELREVRDVTVRAMVQETEVAFRLPPQALVRERSSGNPGLITLDLVGVGVAGTVSRAVGIGGVISVAAREGTDSTAELTIRVADLRHYHVVMNPLGSSPLAGNGTQVRVILDGTGEETPSKRVSLVPERVTDYRTVANGATPPPRTSHGAADPEGPRSPGARELTDDEGISADSMTRVQLRRWELSSPPIPTLSYPGTPLPDALAGLAKYSGHSIVAGLGTDTITVTGSYNNATWPAVLKSMARVYGLHLLVSEDGVITVEQTASIAQVEKTIPLDTRVFHITYVTPIDKVVAALQPHLTVNRGSVTAIGTRGDLLVRDTPDGIARITDVLRKLDRPDRQYRVSAVIMSMSQDAARDLGFTTDIARLGGNSVGGLPIPTLNQTQSSTSGTSSGGTSVYPPGVQSGDPNFFNVVRNGTSIGGAVTPPQVSTPAAQILLSLLAGRYSVASFVQALETNGIARVVSRQTGFVREGETFSSTSGELTPLRTQGFGPTDPGQGVNGGVGSTPNANAGVTNSQSTTGSSANGPGAAVGLEETGTKLSVIPRAEPDSMIALTVEVEQSTAVPSSLGDAGVQFKVNHYSSKFRARDGETKVIGGLQDAQVTKTQSGVPFLSRIPLLGRLFSSTSESNSSLVLVVLITATAED